MDKARLGNMMEAKNAINLNELLAPLFTKHNFSIDGPARVSKRPCKRDARYLAWSNRRGLALFVYDDASIGLRDGAISMKVEIDIDMAHPRSISQLEAWLEAKRNMTFRHPDQT